MHYQPLQVNLPLTINTGWAPYHETLYDAVSNILTLTLTKSSIAQTANCFPRSLNLDIVYIISSLPRLPHTALTVFGKYSIITSYLMFNIHSTKTVSSLVVYLTFDDFRYDCNDDMFKWRWIRLLIILTLSLFSVLARIIVLFVCFNSCHSCHYSCHSVRYMTCWNKRLPTYLLTYLL